MSLSWIFGLLWARKLIILTATAACLLGGIAVVIVAPPRYLATARVTLDFLKRDPITGAYLSTRQAEAYVMSQLQRVTDYQVAVPTVDALGWLDHPDIAAEYASRTAGDRRQYPVWVADRLLATASARMVPESNIMLIEYRAETPELAVTVVEAMRQAYVDANVQDRRLAAASRADELAKRIPLLQAKLLEAERVRTDYSRETGIFLTDNAIDPDQQRLQRMATSSDAVVLPTPERLTEAALELAAADAAIAQAAQSMGPNNPRLGQMRRQRDLLAMRVDAERANRSSSASVLLAEAQAREQRVQSQTEKVLGQRDQVLQLRLYHDEVSRYRKLLNDHQETLADLRQLANTNNAGVTPVGVAQADPTPVFPNPALILGGTGVLGLLMGAFLGLLVELMHRRIRSAHDLELAADVPILGAVPFVRPRKTARRRILKPARGRAALKVARA